VRVFIVLGRDLSKSKQFPSLVGRSAVCYSGFHSIVIRQATCLVTVLVHLSELAQRCFPVHLGRLSYEFSPSDRHMVQNWNMCMRMVTWQWPQQDCSRVSTTYTSMVDFLIICQQGI
jgi:hypothetical protein